MNNNHSYINEQNKTLETLEREWEEEGRYGSKEERRERALRWIPYYSFLAEKQLASPFNPDSDPTGFIGQLNEQGCLLASGSVLDIGAGTGEYSLRFARLCQNVTALEICPASIRVMEKRAEDHAIQNLRIDQAPWEDYETDQSFDLVFASLCPAICTVEELRRMEALSKRSCAIVTVMPGSVDRHRRKMMQELDLHPAGMATKADRYRDVLLAMGRKPRLCQSSLEFSTNLTKENFMKRFTVYFSIFGVSEPMLSPYLENYFSHNAREGVLQEETHMELGLITWEVGEIGQKIK